MPAAVALASEHVDRVSAYQEMMAAAGRKTGRSTMQAARSFSVKVEHAGGWDQLSRTRQLDAIAKARSFASWLMVTGQLAIDADLLGRVYLRLGTSARAFCPDAHAWFVAACARIDVRAEDIALQWNALAMITAVTGVPPEQVGDADFEVGSTAVIDAYAARGRPQSGRNMASIFHRLRLTLFHAGRLDSHRRPPRRPPVSVTGWAVVAPGIAENARRYVAQVELSLRPATTKHIETDLREFGTWLATAHPEVASCADLERRHIEAYKAWVSTKHGRYTGKPLSRVSIKNRLINLHCFFDRTTEWGYPNPPQRPLIFAGDLPIIDKPLPRFLDDAAATKLMRASRADPDPLSRLIVELLARTGIRKSELLALTVDAVVQIGSAFWLRIPVGKLHNDRYIPLHPQLKEMLDDWIAHHRPTGLRSNLLLLERNRPVTSLRVATALDQISEQAGIGHITAHQLRHTLATQAINRGMSLDAIAALLGHKTLAMTMVYARIADKTVAEEYFAVTEKVEALYDQPRRLTSDDEGSEMRKLRGEMHRRMLGNGYCARPVEMDCHFESICESCTFFVTTIEFRPTLQRKREDAADKGQIARTKIFDGLLDRLDHDAS
ncbi:MAG: tyrosine-type recombinase/integrase [Alphaproteobacteria bacterium]|nr:tyrosine-type recombinase/integrase [Alphaproteobacteria bacterium]MBU1802393.1 tyrosine-type recombinase/integrase [Actinomycetota bacterium]